MSRNRPLKQMPMPDLDPLPLTDEQYRRFVATIGPDPLPDQCADGLVRLLAEHHRALAFIKGHSAVCVAAALRWLEDRMRRGRADHDTTEIITNPLFGIDEETFTKLQDFVGAPGVPIIRQLAAVTTRRREIEARPEINVRHGLRVLLIKHALVMFWFMFAVERENQERQWLFVLEILTAAGELGEGILKNPKRLEPLRQDQNVAYWLAWSAFAKKSYL